MLEIKASRPVCQCGCGLTAPLAQRNNARLGHVKGKSLPMISGHNSRGKANLDRYNVVDFGYRTFCWNWNGTYWLREAIQEHHPRLPFGKLADWQATRDDVLARFPEPLVMPRGRAERAEDPITSAERIMGTRS